MFRCSPACNKTEVNFSVNEFPIMVIGRRFNITALDSILSYMYINGRDELISMA
ncbi:hypothetical protein GCM10011445_09060 [Pseudocitrobacter faecalis]|nr:hypothetical protein GCM10011445_09060 [Pseudocitrobacter faecalis]